MQAHRSRSLWDRRWLAIALVALQLFSLIGLTGRVSAAQVLFAGGSGTEADPWLIETAEQLNNVRLNLSASYKLAQDIDLDIAPYNTIGWQPIGNPLEGPFRGRFDGNDHTISNLKISRVDGYMQQGLFGSIEFAQIGNVGLSNVAIQTMGNSTGSLAGQASNSSIRNSYATGSVKALMFVGGLVGNVTGELTVEDSYFKGTVEATQAAVGGLIGSADSIFPLNVSRSYAAAKVLGPPPVSFPCGPGSGTPTFPGGPIIPGIPCPPVVSVAGGLIGSKFIGPINVTASYYDKDVSGQTDTSKGTPKSTSEMKLLGTYNGWDFTDNGLWTLKAGKNDGYPYLKWQSLDEAPTASNVTVSGSAVVGGTLTGGYTYQDAEGDAEGASSFKWYRADDAAGSNKTVIDGANAKTYVPQVEDLGKFISFEVTPKAQTGKKTGKAAESSRTATAVTFAAPKLTAVPGNGKVDLTWSSVTGATYYNVYLRSESGGADSLYGTVTGATYNVTGLTNGKTYYFVVRAIGSGATGPYSNEVSATPSEGAAVIPQLTKVGITGGTEHPVFNDSWYVKVGDTATLTFKSNVPLNVLPSVTIMGQPALVTSVGDNVYKAVHTFGDSETEGVVGFLIEMADSTGKLKWTVSRTTDDSRMYFDKTAPTGELFINNGAAETESTSVKLRAVANDNVGGIHMRFSNDGEAWSPWESFYHPKAWTLTPGDGKKTVFVELKDLAGNVTAKPISASINLKTPSSSSSSSSGGGWYYSPTETISVNVENGRNGGVVTTAKITRTTDTDGKKKDEVTLTGEQAAKLIEQLKTAGSDLAKLILPDAKDEVSELKVTLPKEATAKLAEGKINLEIHTNNARVVIPSDSLKDWKEDVYFKLVPVKSESGRKEVEQRAKAERIVKDAAGNAVISVIGRPMTIQTNMQSRPVTLVLPLNDTSLSEQQRKGLKVFIEHSDGTKELTQGDIAAYDAAGKQGIRFSVNKFSTFTILGLDTPVSGGTMHKAYISGYEDGTFRPDNPITRAEMATVLARAFAKDTKPAAAKKYTDVAESHWAKASIDQATGSGLMDGYPDGSFKPEQTITRAEMASIAAKLKASAAAGSGSFSDTAGHWAAASIEQAKAAGVISGYEDGTFRPEKTLTRAEAVTMLNKLLGRSPLSGAAAKWNDVSAQHWAFEHIQEASVDHASETGAHSGK